MSPEEAEGNYEMTSNDLISANSYLIKKSNEEYDLYIQDQYIATTPYIETSYTGLTIYENEKEVPK